MEDDEYFEQEPEDRKEVEFPPEKCTSALRSRLKCHFCSTTFVNYISLAIHLKRGHRADIKIQCKICQKLFSKPMTFHKHLFNHVPGVTKELLDVLHGGYETDSMITRKERRYERRLLQEQQENHKKIITQNCTESRNEQITGEKDEKIIRVVLPKSNDFGDKQNEIKKQSSKTRRKNSNAPKSLNVDERTRKRRKISCSRCDETLKTEKELAIHGVSHVRIDARMNCSKCSNYFVRSEDYFGHSCHCTEISLETAPSLLEIAPQTPDQSSSPVYFEDSRPSSPPEFIPDDSFPGQPSSPIISIQNSEAPIEPDDSLRSPPEIIPNSPDPPSSLICFEDSAPSPPIPDKVPEPSGETLTETSLTSAPVESQSSAPILPTNPAPTTPQISLQLLAKSAPPPGSEIQPQQPSLPNIFYMPTNVAVAPSANPAVTVDTSEDESDLSCESLKSSDSDSDPEIRKILSPLALREAYECEICREKFQFKLPYVEHKLSHPENTDWLCRQCGMNFDTEANQLHHVQTYHRQTVPPAKALILTVQNVRKGSKIIHKCDLCPAEFTSFYKLIYHQHITHPQYKDTLCVLCGEKFATKAERLAHRRSRHEAISQFSTTICEFCGKSMQQRYLKNHIRLVHPSENVTFMCEDCGKIYENESSYKHHKALHKEPLKCKFDSYQCHYHVDMLLHLVYKHLGPSGFHEFQVPPDAEKPFKCSAECGKEFTTELALKEHKIFHGERTHKCKKCGWKCFTNYHLQVHSMTFHNKGLSNIVQPIPSQCRLCEQTCGNRCELYLHENKCRANLEKNQGYIEVLMEEDAGVISNGNFQRTEDGRGWKCGQCDKVYKNSQDVKYHYRTVHLKIFQFKCQVCGYGANAKGNMNVHMKTKHGGAYCCSVCGEHFITAKELKEHEVKEGHLREGTMTTTTTTTTTKGGKSGGDRRGRSSCGSSRLFQTLLGLDGEEGILSTLKAISDK